MPPGPTEFHGPGSSRFLACFRIAEASASPSLETPPRTTEAHRPERGEGPARARLRRPGPRESGTPVSAGAFGLGRDPESRRGCTTLASSTSGTGAAALLRLLHLLHLLHLSRSRAPCRSIRSQGCQVTRTSLAVVILSHSPLGVKLLPLPYALRLCALDRGMLRRRRPRGSVPGSAAGTSRNTARQRSGTTSRGRGRGQMLHARQRDVALQKLTSVVSHITAVYKIPCLHSKSLDMLQLVFRFCS